jgi:hypothetical protein
MLGNLLAWEKDGDYSHVRMGKVARPRACGQPLPDKIGTDLKFKIDELINQTG